jgi:hypothetical protein
MRQHVETIYKGARHLVIDLAPNVLQPEELLVFLN